MNPRIEAQQFGAFVDGELDLASQLEMEERMQQDAGLRAEVEALRKLRETLREHADYHAAPAALRRRMAALAAPQAAAPERASAVAATLWRWAGSRSMAASLATGAVLAVSLNVAWWHSSQDERLLDEVVASHVRSTLGQHLVDVASSDHHTVKPWLSARLDFSPPVSELPIPGSVFLGGRVDYLDGHPVAALVYRQGAHVVNAFVWPSSAKDSKAAFSVQRGFQTAHWARAGMQHWVISDVNREEFDVVVRTIQAQDAR